MMNKKAIINEIGSIISIIIMIFTFFGISFGSIGDLFGTDPKDQTGYPTLNLPKVEQFDFSKTEIINLKPIKEQMYTNSNQIVCYKFQNPTEKIDNNFTLIAEWFINESEEPIKSEYEVQLNYSEVINIIRTNWFQINNSKDIEFRIVLTKNNKTIDKKIEYELIDENKLYKYLQKDDFILWENDIINELIKETAICSKKTDQEIVEELMLFVRSKMSKPAKTQDINYYDNTSLNSMTSWNTKIGTSSEYSVVYAMLLRITGIPANVVSFQEKNNYYYFVEIYLNNTKWVPVDIYDPNKQVGDFFTKEVIEFGKNYNYITIKGLENIEFISLNIKNTDKWIFADAKIRSKTGQKIEHQEVNIALLDEEYKTIISETGIIGSFEEFTNNGTSIDNMIFITETNNSNRIKFVNITKRDL